MEGKSKPKPILIHPRRSDIFDNPVKSSGCKKGHGNKQQSTVIETFVKIIETQEEWDQFLGLRSRMAVIEVRCQVISENQKWNKHF